MIHTVPHKHQRYDTVGDYVKRRDGITEFRISELGDDRMESLVAIHEIIEQVLCKHKGISIDQIDAFDMSFKGEGEPGDCPRAPYRDQHRLATLVEVILAKEMGVDWKEYEQRIDSLPRIQK